MSIQSLILVENPYYNEPGCEMQAHSEHASASYNQVLRYHTMRVAILGALTSPDAEFAAVIRAHFRARREAVLGQCDRWTDMAEAPTRHFMHDYHGMTVSST